MCVCLSVFVHIGHGVFHPYFSSLQFLCLKNIRTFLSTCCEKFGLKRSELFEAFDLFDVQDFGKVSWIPSAQRLASICFHYYLTSAYACVCARRLLRALVA